jgi:hypothetical protein
MFTLKTLTMVADVKWPDRMLKMLFDLEFPHLESLNLIHKQRGDSKGKPRESDHSCCIHMPNLATFTLVTSPGHANVLLVGYRSNNSQFIPSSQQDRPRWRHC